MKTGLLTKLIFLLKKKGFTLIKIIKKIIW